ncbi:MAG: hypothetical protein WA936_07390 [Erythrobacter sp.]|uniref:CC0125/CC1285 family lipoprotein n=1 Tax=Erythrobacter sp. TaxID=1042 RepID=UPI003C7796C6
MSFKLAIPLLAAAPLALAACADNTPYAPQSASETAQDFGYTSTQLAPDRYRVMFAGNQFTSRATVEDYLIYRAAELTRQQGYDGFAMTRENVDRTTATDVDTYPATGVGTYSSFSPYYGFYDTAGAFTSYDPYVGGAFPGRTVDIDRMERYEASATIDMYRGAAPTGMGATFDATDVLARLGSDIEEPDM